MSFLESFKKKISYAMNGVTLIGNGDYKKTLIEDTRGNGVYSKFRLQAIDVDTSKNVIEVIKEARADDVPAGMKGGVITLSTDINATAGAGIVSKIKAWATTMYNRITSVSRIKNSVYSAGGGGMTIGRFFRGVYKSRSGKTFDENSLSVEVLYIDSKTLETIATDLAKEFNQETVLVKDFNTGEMYFADQKDIQATHIE
jgi:hypothetical protein